MPKTPDPLWPNRLIKPPYGAVEIDWAHPLARGLGVLDLGYGTNLVTGLKRQGGNGTSGSTRWGYGYNAATSTSGLAYYSGFATQPLNVTLLSIFYASSLTYAALCGAASNDANHSLGVMSTGELRWTGRGVATRDLFTGLTAGTPYIVAASVSTSAAIDGCVAVMSTGGVISTYSGAGFSANSGDGNATVGEAYAGGSFRGEMALCGISYRKHTLNDLVAWVGDPWAILRPLVRRSYGFVGGGAPPEVVSLAGVTATAQLLVVSGVVAPGVAVLAPLPADVFPTAMLAAPAGILAPGVASLTATLPTASFSAASGTLTPGDALVAAAPAAASFTSVAGAMMPGTAVMAAAPATASFSAASGTRSIGTVPLVASPATATFTVPVGTLSAGLALLTTTTPAATFSVPAGAFAGASTATAIRSLFARWVGGAGATTAAAHVPLVGDDLAAAFAVPPGLLTAGHATLAGADPFATFAVPAGLLTLGHLTLAGRDLAAAFAVRPGVLLAAGSSLDWPRYGDRHGGKHLLGDRTGGLR
jgi:hypothetical protein